MTMLIAKRGLQLHLICNIFLVTNELHNLSTNNFEQISTATWLKNRVCITKPMSLNQGKTMFNIQDEIIITIWKTKFISFLIMPNCMMIGSSNYKIRLTVNSSF